jgi:hypothetical protein
MSNIGLAVINNRWCNKRKHVYVFLLRKESNLFRRQYVCNMIILPKKSVRCSILERAIVLDPLYTVKRSKAPMRRKWPNKLLHVPALRE